MNLQASTVVNMYFCDKCNCYVERGCRIHLYDNPLEREYRKRFGDKAGLYVDWSKMEFTFRHQPEA